MGECSDSLENSGGWIGTALAAMLAESFLQKRYWESFGEAEDIGVPTTRLETRTCTCIPAAPLESGVVPKAADFLDEGDSPRGSSEQIGTIQRTDSQTAHVQG